MKLIYVGNQEYGAYAFAEEAQQRGWAFCQKQNESELWFLEDWTQELIQEAADWYILDLSAFLDTEPALRESIQALRQESGAEVLLYAPGFPSDSPLLRSLRSQGCAIVTEAENLGRIRQQFDACVQERGHPEERKAQDMQVREPEPVWHEMEPVQTDSKQQAAAHLIPEQKQPFHPSPLRIAVVGSQSRIGTTTAALQLTIWLNQQEAHCAAYLEYNRSGYLASLQTLCRCEGEDRRMQSIRYQNTELYQNPERISDIAQQGYRYLVYDYGALQAVRERASLYEKDRILLVAGAKPGEMEQATEAIRELYSQKHADYLFNFLFTPEEQRSIRDLQEHLNQRTFFLAPASDPFVLCPEHAAIFSAILGTETDQRERRKRHFWNRNRAKASVRRNP